MQQQPVMMQGTQQEWQGLAFSGINPAPPPSACAQRWPEHAIVHAGFANVGTSGQPCMLPVMLAQNPQWQQPTQVPCEGRSSASTGLAAPVAPWQLPGTEIPTSRTPDSYNVPWTPLPQMTANQLGPRTTAGPIASGCVDASQLIRVEATFCSCGPPRTVTLGAPTEDAANVRSNPDVRTPPKANAPPPEYVDTEPASSTTTGQRTITLGATCDV